MTVLAEAISVVISRTASARHYPGGLQELARVCPRETFCADAHLVRAGFYSMEDAQFLAHMLEASGLAGTVGGHAADFVLIDQNLGPLAPCLWIEFKRERDGTPVCWHALGRRDALMVPVGWRRERRNALADVPGAPFTRFVRRIASEENVDWYHDRRSGRLVSLARPFAVH